MKTLWTLHRVLLIQLFSFWKWFWDPEQRSSLVILFVRGTQTYLHVSGKHKHTKKTSLHIPDKHRHTKKTCMYPGWKSRQIIESRDQAFEKCQIGIFFFQRGFLDTAHVIWRCHCGHQYCHLNHRCHCQSCLFRQHQQHHHYHQQQQQQ